MSRGWRGEAASDSAACGVAIGEFKPTVVPRARSTGPIAAPPRRTASGRPGLRFVPHVAAVLPGELPRGRQAQPAAAAGRAAAVERVEGVFARPPASAPGRCPRPRTATARPVDFDAREPHPPVRRRRPRSRCAPPPRARAGVCFGSRVEPDVGGRSSSSSAPAAPPRTARGRRARPPAVRHAANGRGFGPRRAGELHQVAEDAVRSAASAG